MVVGFELLAVVFLLVLPAVPATLQLRKTTAEQISKSVYVRTFSQLFFSLGATCLSLSIAFREPVGLLSFGLDFNRSVELVYGSFGIAFLLLVYGGGYRVLFGRPKQVNSGRKDVLIASSCQTPLQKALLLTAITATAVHEELIFRGYFILLWGTRTNSFFICAVISSVVFVLLHLYQGRQTILFHILLTTSLAAYTIISGSIMAALAAHVWLNISFTLAVWYHGQEKSEKKATSKLALASIIVATVAVITFPISFASVSLVAIVLAIKARRRIARSDGTLSGMLVANVALIIGSLSAVLALGWVTVIILLALL